MVTAEELRDRIDKLTQEAEKLLLKGNFDDARSYREHVHLLRQELEDLTGGPQIEQYQMMKEALKQVLEESKESEKSVHISKAGTSVWDAVQGRAKLKVKTFNGTIPVTPRQVPVFGWDERLERTQADRYMPHLHKFVRLQDRELCLIDTANHHTQLLVDEQHQNQLGYKFRGTTDVAVVTRAAIQAHSPQIGLRLLFELKKRPDAAAVAQAKISLLLANIHSEDLKPVVVLTDLREYYTFFWLDGHIVRVYPAPSSSEAWGLIDLLFSSEEMTLEGVAPKASDPDVMPVAKRQKLVLEQGAADEQGIANLSDLEGLIDPQELRASYVSQLLQQVQAATLDLNPSGFNSMYV